MPRFDRILANEQANTRAKTSQAARRSHQKYVESKTDRFQHLNELKKTSKPFKAYPGLIDTKAFKQAFLRGQDYNITDHVDIKDKK